MPEEELKTKQIVFVGLGNPGKKYEMTRHNIGFMVIQGLASKLGCHLKLEERFQARVARGKSKDVIVHLLLPQTYMNLSGSAVRSYLSYYHLSPQQIVVVADDVAIDFGEIRLRLLGSAGGHNGLKSIEAQLQTKNYSRLRMGIGAIEDERKEYDDLADYVLGEFTSLERKGLESFVDRGVQALERLMTEDVHRVMNDVNAKIVPRILKSKTPEKGQESKHESKEKSL